MNLRLIASIFWFLFLFISCTKEDVTTIQEDLMVSLDEDIASESEKTNQKSQIFDEAFVNWVVGRQQTTGLMESTEISSFTSLYDNALAAIFFIQEDKKENTEKIFDYYESLADSELSQNSGFYQFRNSDGSEPERVWMGDNAWLLIALNQYANKYQSTKYEALALKLDSWLRSLQMENGALKGGTNADGTEIPNVTEGMITAFHAVKGYDDFHTNILQFLRNNRWDEELGLLMAWPENPEYAFALDVLSLSKLIFKDLSDDVLFQANKFLNDQTATLSGAMITGYCFDQDKDVIWLEGTAQMAVAFNSIERYDLSEKIMLDIERTRIQSTISENAAGIPYAANYGTSYGASALWDHADITPALSSTLWYYFAKTNFNPFDAGKKSVIPEADKFWQHDF
ncbi:hypothetical protein [Maribacter sp. 4G9]|uniref:hypothetical protein n=1 Tax=Maribacter sp. 4G9 TaxID=1889777 RepID=UPI001F0A49F3|nr:hypothetical protein [Maribacter sp. 4G9]